MVLDQRESHPGFEVAACFARAANDIICKSLKIKISSRGCSYRLSLGEGERMKVRGWICRAAALAAREATLTLPSPLARERRPLFAPSHPCTKNHSRVYETSA
jgi:hypothetical protein